MPSVQDGEGNALEPHLTKLSGGVPLYIKEHDRPLIKEKLLELESPISIETKPICRRDLGSHPAQSQCKSPFCSTWARSLPYLCLGICSNRKFYCLSPCLFKTTLIQKLFLLLEQISVMYKVPLCSYFCPLKLHRLKSTSSPFS